MTDDELETAVRRLATVLAVTVVVSRQIAIERLSSADWSREYPDDRACSRVVAGVDGIPRLVLA